MTVVAECGGERRPCLWVRRIIGLLPSREVAPGVPALGRTNLQIVVVVDVAGNAGHVGVTICERKARCAVIEFRSEPVVEVVAPLAIAGGKGRSRLGMRRIRRLLPIFQVAGFASRRESVKDSNRGPFVAFLARHCGVRAKQREAILVILDLLRGNVPTLYCVTLLTIRAHLAPMNICVAVGAVLPNVRKNRLKVAVDARNFLVHATQRIVRLVVIELRHGANRTPSGRGVTVFARNGKRTVRAPGSFFVFLRLRLCCCRRLGRGTGSWVFRSGASSGMTDCGRSSKGRKSQ